MNFLLLVHCGTDIRFWSQKVIVIKVLVGMGIQRYAELNAVCIFASVCLFIYLPVCTADISIQWLLAAY